VAQPPDDFGAVFLTSLLRAHPGAVLATRRQVGDLTAEVDPARLRDVMAFLRDAPEARFDMLMDLTGVDCQGYPGRSGPRFEVVYHLYSLERNHRLRVKVAVPEEHAEVDSLCDVWPSADWMEREAWDMYGIRFRGHPDLRRILLYDEFEGHPLRKDYPKERRQPLVGPRN
jgi:NADH-quinone oxidoreductase subunit C